MVEWKSSSVLGVVATSESGTHREQLIVPFVSFVAEKQPTSIAIGWSAPVCGRKLHPPKSRAFHGALFQELAAGLGVVKSTCSAS